MKLPHILVHFVTEESDPEYYQLFRKILPGYSTLEYLIGIDGVTFNAYSEAGAGLETLSGFITNDRVTDISAFQEMLEHMRDSLLLSEKS